MVFEARFGPQAEHCLLRIHAIRGALAVAQDTPVLVKKLQAALLDVSLEDDSTYLRHVAKIAGSILRQYPDDDFRKLLVQLSKVEDAKDEAALELGLDCLKQGLLSSSNSNLLESLTTARDWFDVSLQQSEDRPDARLYFLCTQFLMRVQRGGLNATLKDLLSDIQTAALRYTSFADSRSHSTSWLATSALERFHWLSLATRLSNAAQSLSKDIWLDVALVIEDELLVIFFPGKEIFGIEGGPRIDGLARDSIAERLRDQRYYLQAVEQWLVENEGHEKAASVIALREHAQYELKASINRTPFEGSASSRLVEALKSSGFSDSEASMAASQMAISVDRNRQIAPLWDKIVRQFSNQADCQNSDTVRSLLETLVGITIKFLDFRANIGKSTDPASEYLFRRGDDSPVEHDLQLDFLKFLNMNDMSGFSAEARDIGGGRADIAINFRGIKTIVEVKKDGNIPSNTDLANRYAGQAVGYLTTGIRFGFLLTLDLTDRQGHQPHISEQISVERKVPEGSQTEYLIVVARVQARRKTPHKLK